MLRFLKNVLYGLIYFCVPRGRDSRQTFCDIVRGFIVLALCAIFACSLRNIFPFSALCDFFAMNDLACWTLFVLFELILLSGVVCATLRRWQDLGLTVPKNDSVADLIQRPAFWEVLANDEGSRQKNQYGDPPEDNPIPIVSEADLKNALSNKLFIEKPEWKELKK